MYIAIQRVHQPYSSVGVASCHLVQRQIQQLLTAFLFNNEQLSCCRQYVCCRFIHRESSPPLFFEFYFFLLIGQIKLSLTVQMALLMCQVKPCYFVSDIHGSCMAFPLGFTRSSLGWSRLCDSTRSQTPKGIPGYPSHV